MRYVGIVAIFSICAILGIYLGQIGRKKIQFYLEFKRVLTLLKGEIRYGITPMGEACLHISKKTKGIFCEFMQELAKGIEEKSEDSFAKIWESASEKTLPKAYFTQNEWQMMQQIGGSFGYMDLSMQLRNIELLMEQIEQSLAQARIRQEKDGKIYQTLGIGIGLMFVIVLI